MKRLNEQLAVEVCGATPVDEMATRDIRVVGYEFPDGSFVSECSWNPAEGTEPDLNQLRMCYKAAEIGDVFFVDRFLDALMVLIRPLCACNIVSTHELTHAIFKHPELVAQAILKAKGVS